MQLFSKENEKVECFGSCGRELMCNCQGQRVPLGQQYRRCLVHGKYGSLCNPCLSYLVASTLS